MGDDAGDIVIDFTPLFAGVAVAAAAIAIALLLRAHRAGRVAVGTPLALSMLGTVVWVAFNWDRVADFAPFVQGVGVIAASLGAATVLDAHRRRRWALVAAVAGIMLVGLIWLTWSSPALASRTGSS